MPRKKKESVKKERKNPETHHEVHHEKNQNQILIENFVSLQNIFTTVAGNLDKLNTQVGALLNLFESSAKELAKNEFQMPNNENVLKKIDELFEQNKTIAKGMTLLYEAQNAPKNPEPENEIKPEEQYQKSIFSTPQKFSPLPRR